MLEHISRKIVDCLCRETAIPDEQYDACRYGIETLLHTILSTLGLLGIGLCTHHGWDTVIMVAAFYINQSIGGGFHANSHFKCFASMAIFLLFGIVLCAVPLSRWVYALIGLLSIAVLLYVPLILHKNKQYLADRTTDFVHRARLIVLLEALVLSICVVGDFAILVPITLGLAFSSLSRLIGKMQYKTNKAKP